MDEMKHKNVILTIDVGGSSLKGSLFELSQTDSAAALTTPLVEPIDARASRGVIMRTFASLFHRLLRSGYPPYYLQGLALAFPGPCDYEAGVPLMQGLTKYEALYGRSVFPDLYEILQEEAKAAGSDLDPSFRMTMQNDARMYAMGAWTLHGAPAKGRYAFLTLGTGLGSAFIVEGELLTEDAQKNRVLGIPADGYIYHLPCEEKTVDDCLSTRGLLARYKGEPVNSGKEFAQMALAGNKEAREAFRSFGQTLIHVVNYDLKTFAPDLVFIGGNLSLAWDLFEIEEDTMFCVENRIDVPLVGAAAWWQGAGRIQKKGVSSNNESI